MTSIDRKTGVAHILISDVLYPYLDTGLDLNSIYSSYKHYHNWDLMSRSKKKKKKLLMKKNCLISRGNYGNELQILAFVWGFLPEFFIN